MHIFTPSSVSISVLFCIFFQKNIIKKCLCCRLFLLCWFLFRLLLLKCSSLSFCLLEEMTNELVILSCDNQFQVFNATYDAFLFPPSFRHIYCHCCSIGCFFFSFFTMSNLHYDKNFGCIWFDCLLVSGYQQSNFYEHFLYIGFFCCW